MFKKPAHFKKYQSQFNDKHASDDKAGEKRMQFIESLLRTLSLPLSACPHQRKNKFSPKV